MVFQLGMSAAAAGRERDPPAFNRLWSERSFGIFLLFCWVFFPVKRIPGLSRSHQAHCSLPAALLLPGLFQGHPHPILINAAN